MKGLVWSREENYRFSWGDRERVRTLLLVQKRTKFTLRDVLIKHIISYAIEPLRIPLLYMSNFPLDDTEETLKVRLESFYSIAVDYIIIGRRLETGGSKGYGYFQCLTMDGFFKIRGTQESLIVGQRKLTIMEMRWSDGTPISN
jgi:hypothetical protein